MAAGSTIQLTFQDFSLEPANGCAYDFVQVLDSDGTTELKKLCGASLPSPIRSTGNKMTVLFHSDDNVNKKGFKASWKAVTGTSSGEVTSPNYPAKYPHNKVDSRTISVPAGKKIELTFTYFAIEFYQEGGQIYCSYDKLEIFDGAEPSDESKSYVIISQYKHAFTPLIFRHSVGLS